MIYIIDTNIITAIMKNDENVKRRAQESVDFYLRMPKTKQAFLMTFANCMIWYC